MRKTNVFVLTNLMAAALGGNTFSQELELYENMTAVGLRPCIANVGDEPIQLLSARLNKRDDTGCNLIPALNEYNKPALLPKVKGVVPQSPIKLEVGDQTCFLLFSCARHLVHVSVETDLGPVEWGN